MRYRKLDKNGDFVFGHGELDYHRDSPEAVAQAVMTRLKLWSGEWFLDNQEGTPWGVRVLGKHDAADYDPLIRLRILETPGVESLESYESSWEENSRRLAISATINTVYGQASLNTFFQ